MAKIFKKIKLNWQETALCISAIVYAVYFSVASFLRYDNYYTGRFDLGNMTQTVWNSVHGNIFMLTDPNGTREISRLAFHADFILILLSPLYFLWEDPRMLLLIQTVVLSFGGVFVYLISKHVLKNKTLSLVLALCFFLNPAVNFTNLFDFHPVTLATTFLLAAFYFIFKSKYKFTLIFLILAGITKEQVWIINALIGLYLVFISKQKALGVFIFSLSSLIFYILIWIAIPKNLGGEHFAVEFYSDYGSSPGEVIKNVFLHPIQSIQTLLLPDRIGYLKQLFLPVGYLSLFGLPFMIFASPDLGINLLSDFPPMHQIYYQYSSTVTPFIFLSTIFAIKFIKSRIPEIPYIAFAIVIFLFTLVSAYTFGPLPFAKKPNINMFTKPLAIRNEVDEYINMLPDSESVSATNNLGSHLSHRRNIYVVPLGIGKADRVMFLMRNSNDKEKQILMEIEMDKRYYLIRQIENFYVFKKM